MAEPGLPDAVWPVALFLAGLIAGSFLATLVIRWPQRRSIMRGRSRCDECDRVLSPPELVPMLGALLAHGRCRTCDAPIGPLHWRIELGCGVAGALAGWMAPGWQGAGGALFGWLLIALAALDVAELWLPDALVLPLALAGVATGLAGAAPALADRLIGGAAGFAVLWAIGEGYRRVRGREGLGGGDPKLLGAIGLWLGWRMLPWVLLGASVAGLIGVAIMPALGRRVRRDAAVPFGALLAAAAYPLWLAMIWLGS